MPVHLLFQDVLYYDPILSGIYRLITFLSILIRASGSTQLDQAPVSTWILGLVHGMADQLASHTISATIRLQNMRLVFCIQMNLPRDHTRSSSIQILSSVATTISLISTNPPVNCMNYGIPVKTSMAHGQLVRERFGI